MKLSDYLVQYLVDRGIKKVFLLTGGACAHIVDSLGKNPDIKYVCMQHEQAAAMAADAYARITKNIGVAVATSGPGATNLITGVCCSYFDSIPTLMITGQVNLWETKGDKKIRQLGFQETDIIDIIRPITKFAVLVKDPGKIKYYLDKAIHIAKSGRQGPVWLDIPMNVQHAEINPEELEDFDPTELEPEVTPFPTYLTTQILDRIHKAKRPVIIAGAGIKLGQAENELLRLLGALKIPVVSSWSGIDILPYDFPLYIGQIGVYGNRAANFTVQNSDLLLSLGSRLDTRQTGGQPQTFAREAFKIVVDISEAELKKNWVVADIPVHADVKYFLTELNSVISTSVALPDFSDWHSTCLKWKERYPAVLPEYNNQMDSVNPYVFTEKLSKKLSKNSIITIDNGGISAWAIQSLKVESGQRVVTSFGHAPMGYALPAAIGAASANPKTNVICLVGDGGFQLTIQELQTLKNYGLPIKVFVFNNNAYGIIKQFQEIYFGARYEATVSQTGYTAPDFKKVAWAYGIATEEIASHEEIDEKLDKILSAKGPFICNVKLNEAQKLIPKLIAIRTQDGKYISKPIEDMTPLLPRDEFLSNMIIRPLSEEDGSEKPEEIN
ncbi:MAG TPA: thiamine pyrophosphate-binding protein [Candidatus Paceibacterota bacterium]